MQGEGEPGASGMEAAGARIEEGHSAFPPLSPRGDGGASAWVPEKRKFFLLPQLFFYPLILVTVVVLIYLFMAMTSGDGASLDDLLVELESQAALSPNAPLRAAHELARRAVALEARGEKLDAQKTRKLLGVLKNSRVDADVHRYVVLALGKLGQEELVLPYLEGVLNDPGTEEGARIEAIRGLGLSGSPRAVPLLVLELSRAQRLEDWELRAGILQSLTLLAGSPLHGQGALNGQGGADALREEIAGVLRRHVDDPHVLSPLSPPEGTGVRTGGAAGADSLREEIAGVLRRHVDDPHPVVARNTAMWLAERFGDPAGVETLRRLLDWTYLESQRLNGEESELLMARAIECLSALGDEDSLPLVRQRSRENRSYKVKNAALRALEREAGSPSTGTTTRLWQERH